MLSSVFTGVSVWIAPPPPLLQSSTINAVNIDSQAAAVICWIVVFWIFFTAFQHVVLVLLLCCFVFCHFVALFAGCKYEGSRLRVGRHFFDRQNPRSHVLHFVVPCFFCYALSMRAFVYVRRSLARAVGSFVYPCVCTCMVFLRSSVHCVRSYAHCVCSYVDE